MYLKNLSLRGFKTFADKTVIEFNPPGSITAIVGPNGCGKSNIVDAIRWVLGEQNPKELRSAALEEIIFAGSAARKPLSLAEVSIELDNSDNKIKTEFGEIAVKRRTFRGGESEFFINKASCRLKDIKDLFLDTGLGAGSYAIISQGQVDAILSSKPEERREIFEEAAKINKYKFRKTAAERKLISTEQNMLRIADLKSEISNQINVLEEQAKKAAQYLELKGKLKVLEIGISKRQLKSIGDKKAGIDEKIKVLRSQLELGLNLTQQYETERTSKRDSLRTLSNNIEGLRLTISQCKLSYEENKSLILLEKEKQRNLEERIAEAKTQHENFSSKINILKERHEQLKEELNTSKTEKESSLTVLRGGEENVIRVRSLQEKLDSEISATRSEILKIEGVISDQKNELIELDSNIRLAKEELRHDDELIAKLTLEHNTLSQKMGQLTEKASVIDKLLKDKEKGQFSFPETNETLKATFGSAHGSLSKISGSSFEIDLDIAYGTELKIKEVKVNNSLILTNGSLSGGSLKDKLRNTMIKEREIETLIEQAKVKHESEAGQLELKNITNELDIAKRSKAARANEIASIAQKKETLSQNIAGLNESSKTLSSTLNGYTDKLSSTTMEKDSLLSSYAEQKGVYASIASKHDSITAEFNKNISDIREAEEYLGSRNREQMEERLIETLKNIRTLEESLPKFVDEEKVLTQKIDVSLKDKIKLEGEIEEIEKKLSGGTSDDRGIRDALSKEEVAMAKLEAEITAIAEKMLNEYSMTLELVASSDIEIAGAARSKEEAESLRRAINELGPVNLLATEEFEKAKERFNFIETQFNDLVMARENLSNLIKELDDKARADFIETIKIINKNFSELFATLFEGGEAKLVIPDGADVLEGGIEIFARPGGKRWLNLSVMSGGERALTAIALLFALLRTHPSPFCLLDEADAALDEANVHRYAKLLKEFSKTTQVVLITHNKQTMEIADTMYGITMEEPGVSKIISVKLAKAA